MSSESVVGRDVVGGGLDRATAESFARAYRCLADPTRLLVLNRLAGVRRPLQVGEIVRMVDVGQSTVSHHLQILREGGFVRVRSRGTSNFFEINPECLERFPATTAIILDQAPVGVTACTACEGQGVEPVAVSISHLHPH